MAIPALFLFSCDSREQEQLPILPEETAVSLQDVKFHPTGKDEYTFAVTSHTSYKFELGADAKASRWLHIYLDDSNKEIYFGKTTIPAGTMSFRLKADFNADARPSNFEIGDARECTIRVKATDGSFDEEVDVSQPYPYLFITTRKPGAIKDAEIKSKDNVSFTWDYTKEEPFEKSPIIFTIESNTDWTISTDADLPEALETDNENEQDSDISSDERSRADGMTVLNNWLVAPMPGEYEEVAEHVHSISFIPETYHTEDSPRRLSIVIAGAEYSPGQSMDKYEIDFSQDYVRFMLKDVYNNNCKSLFYRSCYTDAQTVKLDSELEWYAETGSGDSWISLSPQSPATPNTSFSVDISHANCKEGANAYTEMQVGTIAVWGYINKAKDANLKIKKEIKVSQNPYIFNLMNSNGSIAQDIHLDNVEKTGNAVYVQSSGDWTIASAEDWLQLSKKSGMGGRGAENPSLEEVTLTTNNYNLDTKSDRETTVSLISSLNTLKRTFRVTQPAYIFKANAADRNLTTFDTNNHELKIQSTGAWRVDVDYSGSANNDEQWLDFSTLNGSGNKTVTYKAKTGNGYAADRKAKITVVSIPHESSGMTAGVNQVLDVQQRKYTFDVAMSNDTPTFKAITTETYELNIDCSAEWSIDAPEWILVERTGAGNKTLTVRAKFNYGYDKRSGKIVVKSLYEPTQTEYSQEYVVSQDGFVFTISPLSISNVPAFIRDEEYTVSVLSSASWTVVKDDNFNNYVETIRPESYEADKEISVVIKPKSNPEKQNREFEISFITDILTHPTLGTSPDRLTKSVQIKQVAYEFDDKDESFAYEALNTQSYNVDVICSGDWALANRPAWLSVNAVNDKGSGNATIKLTATNNYELNERKASFLLQSTLHKDLGILSGFERSISVSQAAFVFDTDRVTTLPQFGSISSLVQSVQVGDCYGTWNIVKYPSWMNVSSSDRKNISLVAEENVEMQSRKDVVRIESEYIAHNPALYKEIEVSQAALQFDNQSATVAFGAIADLSRSFGIGHCDGGWKVQSKADWVDMALTGSGNETVQIQANANYELTPQTGVVKIVSAKNTKLAKNVTVSQSAFKFDIQKATVKIGSITSLSQSVPVGECYGSWNIKMDDKDSDWLTIEQTADNLAVTIVAKENVNTTSRTAVVRIESEFIAQNTKLYKEITITQDALKFDTTSVSGVAFGSITNLTSSFNIGQCDGGWTVVDKPTWIEMAGSGNGNEQVTIVAQENHDLSSRSYAIKIASVKNASLVKTISVSQAAFKFDTKEESIRLNAVQSEAQNVSWSGCDGGYNIEKPEWIESVEIQGSQIKVIAATNEKDVERQGDIIIRSEHYNENAQLFKRISVLQEAIVFDRTNVTPDSFGAITSLTRQVNIGECDGGWQLVGSADWVTVTPTSGKGNETINIIAQENVAMTSRTATLRIESPFISGNNKLYKEITITQAAFKFDTASVAKTFGATTNLEHTIPIGNCDGEWKVSSAPSWIEVSVAVDNTNLTLTATINESAEKRVGEVVIESNYIQSNALLRKVIVVEQDPFVEGR